MKTTLGWISIGLCALGLASCVSLSDPDMEDYVRGQTVALEAGLATVLGTGESQRIVLLAVAADRVEPRELWRAGETERLWWLAGGPRAAAPTQLFLFLAPADPRRGGRTGLALLDPQRGETAFFETGSVYGAMRLSPDGRYAVLFHEPDDAQAGLYNANEVAVVDLTAPPATALHTVNLELNGEAIQEALFLPTLTVTDADRRLVAFVAPGELRLLDLADDQAATVRVGLSSDGEASTPVVSEILARAGDAAHDPLLFALASGRVFALALVPRPDGDPGFWVSISELDGGPAPSDLALVESTIPLLVVANSGAPVRVIDVDSADTFSLVSEGGSGSRLLVRGSGQAAELVIYDGASRIDFVPIPTLATDHGAGLTRLELGSQAVSLRALDADRMVGFVQGSGDLMVVDLVARSLVRLSGQGYGYASLDRAVVDGASLFLTEPGFSEVASLDLDTGHPSTLLLDEIVEGFWVFDRVRAALVLHPAANGRVTLFPLDDPRREACRLFDGLWVGGFLDD